MIRIAATTFIAITVGATIFAATRYMEPQLQGSDEVNYVNLRPITLQPGQYVRQPVDVQATNLSRISFLYSFQGQGLELVHVMIQSAGQIVTDRDVTVAQSLSDQSPATWWIGSQWDSEARFQPVPVGGPVEGQVVLTITVPASSQPLGLWWSPPGKEQPHLLLGPPDQDTPGKRIAIRTEYGPVRPTITKLPTFIDRVSRYGAPWLPATCLWTLMVLAFLVAGDLVWLVATDSSTASGQANV